MRNLSKALIAEFVGTFALIFVGAGAGALGIGGLVGVAFAHGLVVLAFAYAHGSISGSHINPAVTLGVLLAGAINGRKAFSYWIFQLAGGVCGALALRLALGGAETGLGLTQLASGLSAGGVTISVDAGVGVFIEALLTFFLVNTVLQAAVNGRGGDHAGVAIGMTLTFCILVGGPLTGASLNPARSLGPAVASGNFTDLWIYFVGPLAGGAIAAVVNRFLK
ncbi:MAG: MIP/aquaporin family protein [Thermoanaerobaculia bacterium]